MTLVKKTSNDWSPSENRELKIGEVLEVTNPEDLVRGGLAVLVDKEGNVLKTIKTRDIPGLQKALKPIGIDIHPFFTAGGSIGTRVNNGESRNSGGFEADIGTSLFKFYKIHLNTFLTNRGIYLGPDYKLTDNFGILGGVGKGYEGSTRMFIGGKFDF